MNRSTGIVIGVLVAFASSVAATGSTPPGLPWVTARKPAKILITNGAFSDVGLGVYSNDDDAVSSFQPAAEIASTCTASDGESFNPNTTINITGSHTVDGPTVGNAAIVASRVQSVNRILSADGAAGTPTITATAPVCEIKSDVTRTGTGLVSNSAPVLEVIENDTLGTGSALKITQKATAGDALQVWDTDSKTASVDDQGNASFRDVTSSNEINGVVLSTLTTLDLYDPAPSANAISIQAPSGISSWLMILPPNDGNSGDVLTTDGTGTTIWTAPAAGDITAVGSMTSGAVFADSGATGDCLGLTADCSGSTAAARIDFTDSTVDIVGVRDANLQVGTGAGNVTAVGYQMNIAKSGDAATLAAWTFSNTGTDRSVIAFERARGTAASPSALSAGDGIGEFVFNCYTDSRQECAKFKATAATGFGASGTDAPANFGFYTTPDGSGTALERLTILSDGKVGVGDTTPAALFTVGTSDAFQVDASGNATTSGDVAVNGGDLTTTSSTMNLIPSAATAINIGTTTSADINIGDSSSTVDFGDTASAATAFLPDADAGADLGSTSKHFNAAYFNQEFTGPVRRCTADANCTVATTDRYVFMDEQNSARYVILPDANIVGQTISVLTGNTSGSVTVAVCTKQDANCGSTGTDVIESTNSASFGSPTATLRTSIGNGRRYISTGSGVWIELQSP